ncbi:hypothetical protein CYMTET_57001 [Cymbomonas tetramitiformis]|uniref:Uncharacterized protein n=1 Tax=Cymbomonas tetramitiformis TaxID=36881 RepID=A0AAE0B9S0_9CHLO|nr:hypothetical protein CYMTET_57001 [Cymbomonas tetramitiformis]
MEGQMPAQQIPVAPPVPPPPMAGYPQQQLQTPVAAQVPAHAMGQYAPALFQQYSPATPATAGLQPGLNQVTPIQIDQAPYVPRIDPTTGRPYQSVWRDRHDEEKKRTVALEAQLAAEQKARNDLYQELLAARAETAEAKRATEFEKKLAAVRSGSQSEAEVNGALFGTTAALKSRAVHFEDDGDIPAKKKKKKAKKSKRSKKKKSKHSSSDSSSSSSSSESDESSHGDTTSEDAAGHRRKRQHTRRKQGKAAVRKAGSVMTASGATSPPPSQKAGHTSKQTGSAGPSAGGTAGNAAPTNKITNAQVGRQFKTKQAKTKLRMFLVQFHIVKPEEAMALTDEQAVEFAAKAHREGVLDIMRL